jgi:PAS domain S-box-containing protein
LESALLGALLDTATGVAVVDNQLRYTHFNRALAAMNGSDPHSFIGKTVREVVPHLADALEPAINEVLRSGQPLHDLEVVGSGPDLGRVWLEQLRPLRDPAGRVCAVAVIIQEVTEARRGARLDAFRVALTDALREAQSLEAVQRVAARLLGEYLGVSRAFYARFSDDGERVVIADDYHVLVPSARGEHRLAAFGRGLEARLRAGQTVAVSDIDLEADATDAAPYRALEVRAHATAVLRRDGVARALFGVHSPSAREWRADELRLLEETLERTYAAVERFEALQTLRDSEERFRQLAENTEDIYWITDYPERRALYLSPSFERVTGIGNDDLERLSKLSEFIHPDDRQRVTNAFERDLLERKFDETYRLVRPDGDVRWLRDRAFGLRDADGTVYRVLGVTQDVTERHTLETRVNALQQATSSLVGAQTLPEVEQVILSDLVAALGASGAAVRWLEGEALVYTQLHLAASLPRQAAERFARVGLHDDHPASLAARTGQPVFIADRADFLTRWQAFAPAVTALHVAAAAHLPLKRGTNTFGVLSVQFSASRAWNEAEREFARALADRAAVALERARLFEQVRDSESRLQRALEASQAATWEYDPETREVIYDGMYGPFLGRGPGPGRFNAAEIEPFASPEDFAAGREIMRQAMLNGVGARFALEYRLRVPGQPERWVSSRGRVEAGPDGPVRLVGTLQDITERRALEDQLRAATERAGARVGLADRLRALEDPQAIQSTAARWLVEQLDVDGVFYMDVEDDGEHGAVRGQVKGGPVRGPAQRHRLDAYGPAILHALRRGETVAITDIASDARLDDAARARYARGLTGAVLAYPILRGERLVSILLAQSGRAREWSSEDHLTLAEAGERTAADVERARTQAALRASEQKYRQLFERTDDGFCIVEVLYDESNLPVDYRLLEVNPAFERQTGLSNPVGKTALELVPGLERFWVEIYARVAQSGRPERFELTSEAMGRHFNVHASPLEGSRVAVVFSDISEARARELEARFWLGVQEDLTRAQTVEDIALGVGARARAFLNVTHVLFVEVDETRQHAVVFHDNREAGLLDLNGTYRLEDFHTPEEHAQLNAGEVLLVSDVAQHGRGEAYARGFRALGTHALITAPYTRDGRWRAALSAHTAQPREWNAKDGELLRELATRVFPRLERARAEAALRESEERYRNLFESIDEGFCVLEMIFDDAMQPVNYRFLEVNPAFERQSGVRDATGKTVLELIPDIETWWIETYGRVALSGVSERFEQGSVALGRVYNVYASRVGNPAQYRVALVFNDITERKRAQAQQVANEQRLLEINQAQRRFISDAAHELRAPLTSIRGNLNLLLRHAQISDEERAEMLGDAEREAGRLSRLITDLLALARGDVDKRSEHAPLRFDRLVEDALRSARHLSGDHELTWDALPTVSVNGDRDRLTQLVVVLLENAFKYTPSPGAVHVTLETDPVHARLKVRDTGPGIAPDDLERVFERFYRADKGRTPGRDPGGTGLGLPIARQIATAHGGRVWLESEMGAGTTAVVELPLLFGSSG